MSETQLHTGPTATGQVLGSYRIQRQLSGGAMGSVFRAEHVLLGRPAAVKLLRRDLAANAELVQRFVTEAKAVTACKHPGIVAAYDFGYTPDGHAFIVMELLEGETLGRRLARLRLSEREAVAIALGVASALNAAHKVGVIHRDLKPDNVYLVADPDGGPDRPKVLDFGIAKLTDPSATGHTQTGALIGTPLYMAPEQARAASVIDPRADLYSLGCLLYHMLVGRPPFVAEGGGEIIALQMFGEVEPPSRLAAIAPATERLVLRLLEKEPAQRPASAAEVVAALAEIAAALHAAPRAPAKRSAAPRVAAIAAAVAIAGVGIVYTAMPDAPAAAPASPAITPTSPAVPPTSPAVSPTSPAIPPTVIAAPVAPSVPAPTPAPKRPTAGAPRAARPTAPRTGEPPDRAIEVIRELREPEPRPTGAHTLDGSPLETDVGPARRPRSAPKDAPRP